MKNTKCVVIGENIPQTKKTPIKFEHYIDHEGIIRSANGCSPKDYNYVELIGKRYSIKTGDVIYAYDNADNRGEGSIFFGQWNDGVAE